MDYQSEYNLWLNNVTDKEILAQLDSMSKNAERIQMCFAKNLEFGTAGIRAQMDAGTDRLNIYTIARATQGVANYVKSCYGKCVTVSYDSRNNSELFAKVTAAVFAENGLKVYITGKVQPTAVVSYITRHYNAECGIMITASHNTKEYNGYKVYGKDGSQITGETAKKITAEIEKIDIFSVKYLSFDEYLKKGVISYMSGSVMRSYMSAVMAQGMGNADGLTVVYTPLNGAGHRVVPEILERTGAKVVRVVEQSFPNGNFTTCPIPNPEKPEALTLGLRYAAAEKADILLATDPDCDRVGVAVLHDDKYVRLSGNEIGVLLTDYLLATKRNRNILPKNPVVIKTIVTSPLTDKIVSDYGGTTVNLLTGFKYIGEYITKMEQEKNLDKFVFGFEESCGYLSGSYVRDKDGVVACMLIAQMTAEYLRHGITLVDRLNLLYNKYGRYWHKQQTYTFEGVDGAEKRTAMMRKLREHKTESIAGIKVVSKQDLLGADMEQLPRADVLIYDLINNSQIVFRPSGTEPIIKSYITVIGDSAYANLITDKIIESVNNFFLND